MAEKNISHWVLLGRRVRRHFLAGILVVVPLAAAILIFVWFFNTIDNFVQPAIKAIFGQEIIGLGFLITVVLIYLAGVFASNIVGRRLIDFGESLLVKVPLLKQLYTGTKGVVAGLSGAGLSKAAFREVVLVEFPRKGMRTIAFITNELTDKSGNKLLAIYIPTAPVPTSGHFEIVSEDQITRTDIAVDEAMQMVISSGMVSPPVIDIGMKTRAKSSKPADSPPTPRARRRHQ